MDQPIIQGKKPLQDLSIYLITSLREGGTPVLSPRSLITVQDPDVKKDVTRYVESLQYSKLIDRFVML